MSRHAFRLLLNSGRQPFRLTLAALCLCAACFAAQSAGDPKPGGGQNPERRASTCAARGPQRKSLYGMKFDVPKGMKLKKVSDADYVLYILYPKANEKEHIELWGGPHVGGSRPASELLSASEGVTERTWVCEVNNGTDFTGRTRDGKRWRRTSMFQGLMIYENVSEETAKKFDEVIDGMCCDAEYFKKLIGR
jgi:hypothetical protein